MSERLKGIRNLAAAGLVLATTAGCDGRPLFRDPGCTEPGFDQLHANHIQITTKHDPNKIAVFGRTEKVITGGSESVIGFVTLKDPNNPNNPKKVHAVINTTFGTPKEGEDFWVCGKAEVTQTKEGKTSITITDQELPPPNQPRADIRR